MNVASASLGLALRLPPAVLAAVVAWAGAPAAAGTLAPADSTFRPALFDRVVEHRLDNGMLFLLLPRPGSPTISGRVLVRVGNVDNPAGRTGLAHMFEHMAFKGTDRIGTTNWGAERPLLDSVRVAVSELSAEISRRARADTARITELRTRLDGLQEREAAFIDPMAFPRELDRYTTDFNATTSTDVTRYWEKLPANNLEAWTLLESERLQHPVFREFPQELQVVMEERRQNTEQNPVRCAWELAYSLAFRAHPYRFPIIGYMSDLETLTQADAEELHRRYYVPSNCLGVLVGGFAVEDAERLVDAYFGDIPPGPPPPEIGTVEPEPLGERLGVLHKGSQRHLIVCFPGLDRLDPRTPAADLLAEVLGRDETSRLKRHLDVEEHAAGEINVSSTGGYVRYPGTFEIEVEVLEGFTNEQVEAMVWSELERVVSEPVTTERLDQIRRSWRNAYLRSLETNEGIAEALGAAQTTYGDWRTTYTRFAKYAQVTPDDVTNLARDLFRRDHATIVRLEPEEEAGS